VNTEKTVITAESRNGEWVLYDGECSFCTSFARRFENTLTRRGFGIAPLQTPWAAQRLGLKAGSPPVEMTVLRADGSLAGGARGVVYLARKIWWALPLFIFAQLPGAMRLLDWGYRFIAARRHCLTGACARKE